MVSGEPPMGMELHETEREYEPLTVAIPLTASSNLQSLLLGNGEPPKRIGAWTFLLLKQVDAEGDYELQPFVSNTTFWILRERITPLRKKVCGDAALLEHGKLKSDIQAWKLRAVAD